MDSINKQVIKVKTLVSLPDLSIPAYQRPYKWSQTNLADLLSDLKVYRKKSAYRLGSVVFHKHSDSETKQAQLDIVDGQQRTLTLVLLVKALIDERLNYKVHDSEIKRQDVKDTLVSLVKPINAFLGRQAFNSDISHRNLHQNFMAAKRAVARSDFTEADIDFLLNHCEVVTFVLDDVSEAFQFFDSQNARGRDLDPHDLLKAFHLREFSQSESQLKADSVRHWESLESEQLARLFANYLFRIRNWAQGKSAQYFNKSKVGLFKGVNLDQVGLYPYVEPLRIAHHFVDDYNGQYQRHIDHQHMRFPFHLDQMIINGRRFFEMTSHYQHKINEIVSDERSGKHKAKNSEDKIHTIRILDHELEPLASKILHTLNTYSSRIRTGDGYIRTLFDCAVIFYLDKFGAHQLSQAIEKLFIWAYSCRLQMQVVGIERMDKHALTQNVFELIKQAVQPSDVLNWPLGTLKASDCKGTKLSEITKLFKEMNYYE
ncbi:MAG: hypothetical protein CMK65_09250 [Pseudoalteromonas sp.]|uniref:DUF262 domain-containing protein n=1 Tax=Pseudoalteromonas TaxID=53246 RepID=UPI000C8CB064|nr:MULTISPECIES: DUF262 domain-containing protein [unclassified Pseudoalteromonas]MAD03792.1 hypothetical protein [Pseudoalteromonas sp.]|tara:strand:- start:53817 stop:55274 length:1458 start_codon:yes stop_codon:yes gene_type:complete